MLFKTESDGTARIKMIRADGWLILDTRTNDTFAFEEDWGHVMKLPLVAGAEGVWVDPRDYVDPEAELLGEERIDGTPCWIINSSTGPLDSKVWIGTTDGLVRQLETEEGITRLSYSRFDEVDDGEFSLPPDLRVVELSEMVPGKS